jgi:IS605 OrfB family transposase
MSKITKVVKLQIVKPIDIEWDTFRKMLYELQRETRQAMNKSLQMNMDWLNKKCEYFKEHGVYPNEKDEWGMTFGNVIYQRLSKEFNKLGTGNLSQALQQAQKKFQNDAKNILRGDVSLPSYKKNNPIYLHKKSVTKINKIQNDYVFSVSLLSKKYKNEFELKNGVIDFVVNAGDNSLKIILNRIISGEYEVCGSTIKIDKKIFLYLSYNFENFKRELNSNIIVGVDLGIINAVYLAVNNGFSRDRIQGGEIENFRRKIEARKNSLLHQGKYCGDGRIGHGIKKRIEPIDFARDKVSNFRDTCNHRYSKFVIDFALKNNAEAIQIEDLSGINEESTFLKNWSYFDLINKIEYKAKNAGIQVIKINPQYTSQRCSKCGHIHEDNRQTQALFVCTSCGYKTSADYNAAKNISTQNIENIIKEKMSKGNSMS